MNEARKRNSSKTNLTISVVFHTVLILSLAFFAAREGMLGKKLKMLTVTMVPKEKKPEPPKEKPAPKLETPKVVEAPKPAVVDVPKAPVVAPPPAVEQATVAPAAVALPEMDFHDGAHDVETASDPNAIYKGLVELALRSRWTRPENVDDQSFQADVQLTVDADGNIQDSRWLKGSGNSRWDDSVKAALAQTKAISRPPPKGFPSTFTVRFDVESPAAEGGLQFSSR